MKRLKWIVIALLSLVVVLFFHYSLPSRDVVQIVGTDVKRMDVDSGSWLWAAPDAGTNAIHTRDVRFINAVTPTGKTRVYRNEDTDWGWPPYFKFDSSDLNAQAQAYAKMEDQWVAVTSYGWRIKFLSMFPNAVKIKPVAGPDVTLIPWFNIVFLTLVAALALYIFLKIRQFKRRRVDPVLEDVGEVWDSVEESAEDVKDSAISLWTRLWRWITGLFKG